MKAVPEMFFRQNPSCLNFFLPIMRKVSE